MRASWIPIFVALVALGCGVFTLFPPRWSPDPSHGILAGMVMYFVGFSRAVAQARAGTGEIPPLFGRKGIFRAVAYRTFFFLAILTAIAYVYFDRRASFDVTWPLLILASWNLAEGMLRERVGTRWGRG